METDTKHLWEYDHPYYCEMQNYRANAHEGCAVEYDAFAEFLEEWGDNDLDLNLLFRWDWIPAASDEDGEPLLPLTGDGGELRLCFMIQRKGDYRCATVRGMREEDEANVLAYLTKYAQHMRVLWAPLL